MEAKSVEVVADQHLLEGHRGNALNPGAPRTPDERVIKGNESRAGRPTAQMQSVGEFHSVLRQRQGLRDRRSSSA